MQHFKHAMGMPGKASLEPYRDGILEQHLIVDVSGHKLGSSQTQVFVCWFSTCVFFHYIQITNAIPE
jgi:hypothetical protein